MELFQCPLPSPVPAAQGLDCGSWAHLHARLMLMVTRFHPPPCSRFTTVRPSNQSFTISRKAFKIFIPKASTHVKASLSFIFVAILHISSCILSLADILFFFSFYSLEKNQSELSRVLVLEDFVTMEWPELQGLGEKELCGHNAGMKTACLRAFLCSPSCRTTSLAGVKWGQCRLAFQSFLCCLATVQAVR